MAALNNQIQIAEMDYDQILTNLVAFMKEDPAFADYDFAGSGLRLLARVLAYVVFYQNYYLTAAVNESFLETAQLRSSVASHARMLGYNLKGTQSARLLANVAVELQDSSAPTMQLPKRTQFILSANSGINFYNLTDVTLTVNGTTELYEASGVELVEGRPLKYQFTVDLTNPTQRFIIPNANVDFTTIEVQVQASPSSNVVEQFQPANNYLIIDSNDPVFFVQEAYNGYPELKFGNGVVGRSLSQNNVILVDYLVSRGMEGNNIRGPFSVPTANVLGFVQGATVADGNTTPSAGGVNVESLDSARYLAPLVYQAQNRCVTAEDYKSVILSSYGDRIGAINVFGGEEGDPSDPQTRPVFGRVFIALKPTIGQRFTDVDRQFIEDNVLKPRSIVGVIPQVIDPDYTYIHVSTSVRYDPRATTRTKPQLTSAIVNSITTFTQNHVEKFDSSFRFSRFIRVIDETDDAIVSSTTRIDLEKRVFPNLNASNQFVLKFNSGLRRNKDNSAIREAKSHRFSYVNVAGVTRDNCFLYEQNGTVHIAYRDVSTGQITLHVQNIGSVDVSTGLTTISNFAPTALENNESDVRIAVTPTVNDFVPHLNQLFTIDPEEGVTVQLLNDGTFNPAEQETFFDGGILN
jgi:hypothetical protein